MNAEEAKKILDKIVGQVMGYQNPLSLEQFMQKFAFDIQLPQMVYDSTDGSQTWARSAHPTKFIKIDNARARSEQTDGLVPKRPINSLQDLLAMWDEINLVTTERSIDCINIAESDSVYRCENVYRSQDIRDCKNIIFSDGLSESEYVAVGQRSNNNAFCIRIEDSINCSNSFGIQWSNKITNSIMIHDCYDMKDSMFCTNMRGRQYCVANMQLEETEYKQLRQQIVQWLLSPAS